MADITRGHMETLGQTGEGIKHAEDVDMSLNNQFTNKWAEIIAECPWFLEMRSLIAERPNLVPTGIGNSATDIDLTGDMAPSEADATMSTDGFDGDQDAFTSDSYPDVLNDDIAKELEMSDEDAEVIIAAKKGIEPEKRKYQESDSEDIKPDIKPKKGPRPGTSKPAAAPMTTKKKSRLEEFGAVAQAEELTRQRELELNKAKLEASTHVKAERSQMQRDIVQANLSKENARVQAKKEITIEKMRLKAKVEIERMRLKARRDSGAFSNGASDFFGGSSDLIPNASLNHYENYSQATPSTTGQDRYDLGDGNAQTRNAQTYATRENTFL